MNTKICKICKLEKSVSEFSLAQQAGTMRKDGSIRNTTIYKTSCKECYSKKCLNKYHKLSLEEKQVRRSKNSCNNYQYRKEYRLRNRYGLTTEEFSAMLLAQNNKCKICGDEMLPPQVDHNHLTSEVRSLLCRPCNTSLGLLREDPQILRNMISYIYDNL
jgi:hypothetical protein